MYKWTIMLENPPLFDFFTDCRQISLYLLSRPFLTTLFLWVYQSLLKLCNHEPLINPSIENFTQIHPVHPQQSHQCPPIVRKHIRGLAQFSVCSNDLCKPWQLTLSPHSGHLPGSSNVQQGLRVDLISPGRSVRLLLSRPYRNKPYAIRHTVRSLLAFTMGINWSTNTSR